MGARRPSDFWRRFLGAVVLSAVLIGVSLGIGVLGYHYVARLSWVDATYNAAMILTGMGPVDRQETTAAKLFATAYALYAGFVFVLASGILLSPMVHRVLHRFHVDDADVK